MKNAFFDDLGCIEFILEKYHFDCSEKFYFIIVEYMFMLWGTHYTATTISIATITVSSVTSSSRSMLLLKPRGTRRSTWIVFIFCLFNRHVWIMACPAVMQLIPCQQVVLPGTPVDASSMCHAQHRKVLLLDSGQFQSHSGLILVPLLWWVSY